jgi:uncharacterized membrane protein YesL
MRPGSFAARAWELVDVLTWIAALNLAIVFFTALGGIVFGIGPSAVAAATLVRRRARGDIVRPLTEFWAVYRTEFVRANTVLLPVLTGIAALAFSCLYFHGRADVFSAVVAGLAIVLLAFALAIAAVLVPVYSNYQLPLGGYLPAAVKLCVANPLLPVLNLVVIGGVFGLTWVIPGILPFFTSGLLCYLGTRLSLDFINRNEKIRVNEPISQ